MNLGFVFYRRRLKFLVAGDSYRVADISCREEQRKTKSLVVPRPYLSEAWEFQSDKWKGRRIEKDSMVIDLRMIMKISRY